MYFNLPSAGYEQPRVPGKNHRALSSVIKHQGSTASMPQWFWAPDHLKWIRSHQVMSILVYWEYILIYRVLGKNHRALSSVIEDRGSTASMSRWFRKWVGPWYWYHINGWAHKHKVRKMGRPNKSDHLDRWAENVESHLNESAQLRYVTWTNGRIIKMSGPRLSRVATPSRVSILSIVSRLSIVSILSGPDYR